jgi:hypothetical protein
MTSEARMFYVQAIIGSKNDTTDVDGYVLSVDRPSVRAWMKGRLPEGYRILETHCRVCPSVNMALIRD